MTLLGAYEVQIGQVNNISHFFALRQFMKYSTVKCPIDQMADNQRNYHFLV